MNRKQLKREAKTSLKRHYILLVSLCLAAALLGTEFTESLALFKSSSIESIAEETENVEKEEAEIKESVSGDTDLYSIFMETFENTGIADTDSYDTYKNSILGRSNGVFANIVNTVASGKIWATAASALRSVFKSDNTIGAIFIVLSLALAFFFWLFVKQVYKVALRRVALTSRTYERTDMNDLRFVWQNGRWKNVAGIMLRVSIYQWLWDLTIVGGIVKAYSYFLVPYIVAENPEISGKDAILLSRRMMNGHKWECFVWSLSFIGWDILSYLSFGLLYAFFVAPYKSMFFADYYSGIRKASIKSNVPGTESLSDTYLFEKAPDEVLRDYYGQIINLSDEASHDFISSDRGFKHFMAVNLGISLYSQKQEEEYDEAATYNYSIESLNDAARGNAYPLRLCPVREKEKEIKINNLNPLRHYSLQSLVLIFFGMSLVGWIWEVTLGFIQYGSFINRGTLFGPWLPIYGSGAILILTLLMRFRKHPLQEFFAAVVLCGAVEYTTSVALEYLHDGMRWWDYSGYFLNINGRVCAEGLLVFGLGGIASVYYLCPVIDTFIRKMNKRTTVCISILLLCLFAADLVYSHFNPNTGAGITDYLSLNSGVSSKYFCIIFPSCSAA